MTIRENFNWLHLDKEKHCYTDKEGNVFLSVSNFVDQFIEDTFTDAFIEDYAKKKDVDASFIKTKWKIEADYSSVKGIEFHFWVETFIKEGLEMELVTPIIHEVEQFKEYWKAQKKKVEVVDQEVMIASKKYRIAGTIDFLGIDKETGKYVIQDWKTNKRIRREGFNGKKMLPPFEKYDDCELSKYSLQQGLYRRILELELGLEFKDTRIVHFSPSYLECKSMLLYDLQKEIDVAFAKRLAQIELEDDRDVGVIV